MKFDASLLDAPDLGVRVLKALERLTPLPTTGIVAGQSVASAIDEVLGICAPIYNDVDVFAPAEEGTALERELEEKRARLHLNGALVYASANGLFNDEYSDMLHIGRRSHYQIKRTSRKGALNAIEVFWHETWRYQRDGKHEQAMDLISVFDINSTQAAVDLDTRRLAVTPQFRHYFSARQLQLATMFTPFQSLLRLIKKSKELPICYVDLDQSLRMAHANILHGQGPAQVVALRRSGMRKGYTFVDPDAMQNYNARRSLSEDAMEVWTRIGQSTHSTPLCFGIKHMPLYERYADQLGGMFALTPSKSGKLWLVTANEQPQTKSTVATSHYAGCVPPLAAERFRQWDAKQNPLVTQRRERFMRWHEGLSDSRSQSKLISAYQAFGDAYLEGLDSDKHLQEVMRVQKEHSEFACTSLGMAFKQQHQLLRGLRKLFRACNVPEAWGVLRNKSAVQAKALLDHPEQMEELIKELIASNEPYVQALALPKSLTVKNEEGNEVNVEVVQLLSQLDLNTEGGKMRHCVAGYGSSVKGHNCRILSLRMGESSAQRATVEWVIEQDYNEPPFLSEFHDNGNKTVLHPLKVECRQIVGPSNSKAPAALVQAQESLCADFNVLLSILEPEAGWAMLKPGEIQRRLEVASRNENEFGVKLEVFEEIPF